MDQSKNKNTATSWLVKEMTLDVARSLKHPEEPEQFEDYVNPEEEPEPETSAPC